MIDRKCSDKLQTALLILALGLIPSVAFPASPDAAVDCRMDEGPCKKASGYVLTVLDITPRPLKVMSELFFTARILDRAKPVDDASVILVLTMPGMVMGSNMVRLLHKGDGVYEGTGVIVRCPTGKKLWKATIMIDRNGRKQDLSYTFEVTQ